MTQRRRRKLVSQPVFGEGQAPPEPTAPSATTIPEPEDILDYEEAVSRDADALPLRASDAPTPESLRRAALTDELDGDHTTVSPLANGNGNGRHPVMNEPVSVGNDEDDFESLLSQLSADEDLELVDVDVPDDGVNLPEQVTRDVQPPPPLFGTPEPAARDQEMAVPGLFEQGLDSDTDFWATLETSAEEESAPSFEDGLESTPGQASKRLFGRRSEPKPVEGYDLEKLSAERQVGDPLAALREGDAQAAGEAAFAPLGVDDAEEMPAEKWQPRVHVAARQASFAGPNALSLLSPSLKEDVDELNHALSAFAELGPGQKGFIRLSVRTWPGFKEESRGWLAAQKTGVDPNENKGKPHRLLGAWIKYGISLFWFEINKANPTRLGGLTPPMAPGKHGNVKPLRMTDVSDETKQTWKDAERKVLATPHYEVALRVATVGKNEAAEEIERICDEVAAGFEVYATPHQELLWAPVDPYDTAIGYMGTKRQGVPLALSADEIGELARVPDDLTRPQGINVKRSTFKQLTLPNPIVIEDPYNPKPGLIPLGVMNPRSEDAICFGMRVQELDKHMYYVGATGTGKSELMKWLVFGVAKADYPMVVIDPHGALSEDLLNMLVINCPERMNDIIMCDLADPDWPVALNPLDVRSFEEIEPTVHSIMEMLARQMSLGQGAPRAVNLASQVLAALCEANLHIKDPETKNTLLSVVRFLIDTDYRRLVIEFVSNTTVRETFDAEKGPFEVLSDKQQSEFAMPIIRAFQPLGSSESFSAVFSAGENRLDFGKLIGSNKIILVKLARFSHQKKLGEFVGSLILPWLLSSMDSWGRKRDPETGEYVGRGCRVFVDEAPTLIGPESSAIELLAESRKWDLGMITTSQYPSQFDRSVIGSLFANTNTKICMRLDPSEASAMSKSIAGTSGKVTAGDVADLPNFHYYANVMLPTGEGSGAAGSGAFSAACLPPINCDLNQEHKILREQVRQRSRELICNAKADIDAKRPNVADQIVTALQQMLIEKSDAEANENAMNQPGGSAYSLNLDDDQKTFSGW